MSGSRNRLALASWGLVACAVWPGTSVAAELLIHSDLPPGVLYTSGVGDTSPAAITPIIGDPFGAFAGNDYLQVKTGTVPNGGQTFGGVQFAMPDTYLNLPLPHFYRLSFALKSSPFGPPIYDVHVSNQDGLGEANTLSHDVTVDAGWLRFEHETTLTDAVLPSGLPNVPRRILFFWTDAIHGGPNQTFYIDAIQLLEFFASDFDEDGDVDGDDFLAWQLGFGSGSSHSAGDADGDGDVDGEDFLIWQRQFGNGAGRDINITVPEPQSCGLSLAVICVALVRSWRQRSTSGLRSEKDIA